MKVKTCFDADAGISDHLICDVNYKYKHALLRTASSSASMNHPPFSEDEVTTSATMTISQRLLYEILATVEEAIDAVFMNEVENGLKGEGSSN